MSDVTKLKIGDTSYNIKDSNACKQVAVMPTAAASNLGQIVQYIGTTSASYTNGYFYECVLDGANYVWEIKRVQEGGGNAVFDITLSGTDPNYTVDKTPADVEEAIAAEQVIRLKTSEGYLALIEQNSGTYTFGITTVDGSNVEAYMTIVILIKSNATTWSSITAIQTQTGVHPTEITWEAYQALTSAQKAAKRYLITDYPGSDADDKADKVSGATAGNFAGLDASGNLTDSGKKASDFASKFLENINRRTRNNISSNLTDLPAAVSEQNLAKYGYTVGDYFDGPSGYTYILSDMNPFKGTVTPYCINANHLGLIVNTHTTSQWHTESAANVGYAGSTIQAYLASTVLDTIKSDMIALFGGSTGLEHLYSHSKLFTTALASWAWSADQYISALTCTQIDAGSQWTANGYQEGEASKSLELFRKYKWTEIFGGEYLWLRNISNYDNTASYACRAHADGYLGGRDSVTGAGYAVGLIIFH